MRRREPDGHSTRIFTSLSKEYEDPGSILEFTYVPSPTQQYDTRLITEDTKDRSIDVYPNPASAYVIVYNYVGADNRMIDIVDLSGRIVNRKRSSARATRIETSSLPNGIYILKVADSKGKSLRTEKIIIQH